MQADDGHAQERNSVIGAQDALAIAVDVKDFVQGGEVAYVEVVGTRSDQTVES